MKSLSKLPQVSMFVGKKGILLTASKMPFIVNHVCRGRGVFALGTKRKKD